MLELSRAAMAERDAAATGDATEAPATADLRSSLAGLTGLLGHRGLVRIAHHLPGRVRIRLNVDGLLRLPHVDPRPALRLIERIRGVTSVRINIAALSAVVEYDARTIAPSVWERLLVGDAAEVERILTAYLG